MNKFAALASKLNNFILMYQSGETKHRTTCMSHSLADSLLQDPNIFIDIRTARPDLPLFSIGLVIDKNIEVKASAEAETTGSAKAQFAILDILTTNNSKGEIVKQQYEIIRKIAGAPDAFVTIDVKVFENYIND